MNSQTSCRISSSSPWPVTCWEDEAGGNRTERGSSDGSPAYPNVRKSLARQGEIQVHARILSVDPCRRTQEFELCSRLQLLVLGRGRRLWCTHLLPCRICIAVSGIN